MKLIRKMPKIHLGHKTDCIEKENNYSRGLKRKLRHLILDKNELLDHRKAQAGFRPLSTV